MLNREMWDLNVFGKSGANFPEHVQVLQNRFQEAEK
jgi:hypothetical protein